MEPRLSLVALEVHDLRRAVAFYRDGLGWPKSELGGDEVAFFKIGGAIITLFPRAAFAADAGVDVDDVEQGRFSRFSLAHNVVEEEDVDSVLAKAAEAGATIHRRSSSGATVSSRIPTGSCGKWRGNLPSRWPQTAVSSCPNRYLYAVG